MNERTQEILKRLENVKEAGKGWDAFCPVHGDDHARHLHVEETEDGRTLAYCHRDGCTYLEVLKAIGLEARADGPKPVKKGNVKQFFLRDETGQLIAIHCRRDIGGGKKKMWWSLPDGSGNLEGRKIETLPLFGAEMLSAIPVDTLLVLTEGEKSAYYLTARGLPAVATVTGAHTTPSYETLRVLSGRPVVLWPDNDIKGKKHMQRIGKLLLSEGITPDVKFFSWADAPEAGDAADHPSIKSGDGQGLDGLRDALAQAPRFKIPRNRELDGAVSLSYAAEEAKRQAWESLENKGVTGIYTGIPKIDKQTHGLNKGQMYIVAARPSVGKSLLTAQMALTAARRGHRVLFQSSEMSEDVYMKRLACYSAGVNYFHLMNGELTREQTQKFCDHCDLMVELPISMDDWGGQNVERIRQNIEKNEPDLLIIDYLQHLKAKGEEYEQITQLSKDVSALKTEYEIPVVVAAQLNRNFEHRGNVKEREPELSDLRGSGQIEQDADYVLMLHRPEQDNPAVSGTPEEPVRVFCRKDRNGLRWNTTLYFVPGQQWLVDKPRYVAGVA